MIGTISGTGAGLILIILYQLLSKYFELKLLAATTLVAIAFIYVGFSLKNNPASSIILESGIGIMFYFLAIIGYTRNNLLIAYGIMLHGIWDIFHHNSLLVGTDIPDYWPSFCFMIDIIDGVYFIIAFKGQRHQSSQNI